MSTEFASPAQRMSFEDAFERLDAIGALPKRSNGQIRSRCPVHEGDRDDALAIVKGTRGADFAAACHAECGAGTEFFNKLLDRLRTGEEMAPADPSKARSNGSARSDGADLELVAEYLYVPYLGSRPMWRKARYRTPTGRKTFRWFRWIDMAGGTWAQGLARQPESELPLYGWQLLKDLGAADATVYWVEGEKSVERALEAGLIAVTSCGGAKGPLPDDLEVMRGRDVVVIADRDNEGSQYAVRVEQALTALDCTVRLARTPINYPKADLVDHLDAGLTIDDLEYAKPKAERAKAPSHGIRFHWAIDDDPEHVEWLIDGFMPAHCLIIVAGREGAGKSTLAARIIAVATRGELTGEPVKCLVLGTEDGWRSRWIPRLHASGADLSKVSRDPEIVTVEEDGEESVDLVSIADPGNLARLARAMAEEGIGLLYLDHLGDALAIGTDHNAYGQVTAALKTINRWATANQVTVIGGWHLTKGAGVVRDKVIGSVGFRTSARCVALVAEDQEAGHRLLAIDKCNDLDVSNTPARVFDITQSTVEVKGSMFSTTAAGPLSLHPGDCGRDAVQQLIDEGSATDDPDDRDNRQDMADFIRDYVTEQGGSALAKDATAALHAKFGEVHTREVGKARRKAGVSSKREGFGKGAKYLWRLMESMQSRSRERDSMDFMGDSMDRACADCGAPIGSGFVRCKPCIRKMKGGES